MESHWSRGAWVSRPFFKSLAHHPSLPDHSYCPVWSCFKRGGISVYTHTLTLELASHISPLKCRESELTLQPSSWGDLCPMRFSSSIDEFYLLPPASESYDQYRDTLIHIAQSESATLFIPVSGAGSSVEDAQAAETMTKSTGGRCRTFIQDPETMKDLHDKDRFMALVDRLGFTIPAGRMVESVKEAIEYLKEYDWEHTNGAIGGAGGPEPRFILKCMGLDENRGDMTLFPLKGDDVNLGKTRRALEGLRLGISKKCPYVFQEFIPGPGKLINLLLYPHLVLAPLSSRVHHHISIFSTSSSPHPPPH